MNKNTSIVFAILTLIITIFVFLQSSIAPSIDNSDIQNLPTTTLTPSPSISK